MSSFSEKVRQYSLRKDEMACFESFQHNVIVQSDHPPALPGERPVIFAGNYGVATPFAFIVMRNRSVAGLGFCLMQHRVN